jgi:hypothetical protein
LILIIGRRAEAIGATAATGTATSAWAAWATGVVGAGAATVRTTAEAIASGAAEAAATTSAAAAEVPAGVGGRSAEAVVPGPTATGATESTTRSAKSATATATAESTAAWSAESGTALRAVDHARLYDLPGRDDLPQFRADHFPFLLIGLDLRPHRIKRSTSAARAEIPRAGIEIQSPRASRGAGIGRIRIRRIHWPIGRSPAGRWRWLGQDHRRKTQTGDGTDQHAGLILEHGIPRIPCEFDVAGGFFLHHTE